MRNRRVLLGVYLFSAILSSFVWAWVASWAGFSISNALQEGRYKRGTEAMRGLAVVRHMGSGTITMSVVDASNVSDKSEILGLDYDIYDSTGITTNHGGNF